ncbi:hypothetical protein OROGR_007382 [Orobanche gracilis]
MATAALLCCSKNTDMKSQYASLFQGKKRAIRSKGVKGITIKKPLVLSSHSRDDDDDDDDDVGKGMNVEKKRKLGCWEDYADDVSKVPSSVCVKEPRLVSGCVVSIYDYECLDRIGHGTYGTVFRARHTKTGQIVAVKKELHGISKSSLMEIDILRSLDHHPSIIGYKQVAVDDHDGIYIVMEYVEYDLREYLKRPRLALPEVKRLMKELLEGVKFLHENSVMHRDLKPSNVLISTKGKLKICDFGMSRHFPNTSASTCTPIVGTLWYRAPELLLEEHVYSSAVDMWSVGCIMAEFFLGEVLFRGKSEIHQLRIIYSGDYDLLYDKLIAASASRGGPTLTEAGFELLCRLLAFHLENRITAEDALNHDWFEESSS